MAENQLSNADKAWLTPDPKATKFYPVSPDAFCLNNPIRFIDPNGEEVWIHYQNDKGNAQKLLYTANMEYKGSNSFVTSMIANLNSVYSNGGNKMLDVLIRSENAYIVLNRNPDIDGAGGAFRRNMDGGGSIFAGKIGGATNFSNVETTAHEFMHGAQHELGQGGPSVFNEVEAYVFGYGVAMNYAGRTGDYGGSLSPNGVEDSPASSAWESSFSSLHEMGYSSSAMVDAVNSFKTGAQVNAGGQYNRVPALLRLTTEARSNHYYRDSGDPNYAYEKNINSNRTYHWSVLDCIWSREYTSLDSDFAEKKINSTA
ncbi:hypothetical protein [Alistipes sp.]|uniref:hypothetical protein n=1 Tax=Alistipes sp. TaxID=1872444 RepID=UPI003AF07D8D